MVIQNHRYAVAAEQAKLFKRDILKKVYSIPALENILIQTSPIDYAIESHLRDEDDGILRKISLLHDELDKGVDEKRRVEILEEINKFDPEEEVKYLVLIEKLISNSENHKFGIGLEEESFQPLYYNGCFWELMTLPLLKEFLAEIATKSGFNYYKMRITKNLNKLHDQFSTVAILPTHKHAKNEAMINLLNGTYVITKAEKGLRDFRKEDYFKYQLPFKYDRQAECQEFHKFLDKVLPEVESQMILSEYLAYIFVKGLKLEKCLILYGTGSNGKSVIFDIVHALLGSDNVCTYTLSNLCNENGYFRAQLGNYLLNYSSELGGNKNNVDMFKKLVSNEPIDARSPYGKPFILREYGKFMFNANKLPYGIEFTNAFWRRFIFLSFDVTIEEKDQEKGLADRIISTELSGIFNWVLEGLERLLMNEKFTESPKSIELLESLKTESDTVAMFLTAKNYLPSHKDKHKVTCADIYKEYKLYCKKEDMEDSIVKPKEFRNRLKLHKYTVTMTNGGKQWWTYVKGRNPFDSFGNVVEEL